MTKTPAIREQWFVYRNLHKKTYSLRSQGIVRAHADWVMLTDVTFKVSEVGRQKVIATRRKNVHAGCLGVQVSTDVNEIAANLLLQEKNLVQVWYNPYQTVTFVRKDTGEKCIGADRVFVTPVGVFALGLRD